MKYQLAVIVFLLSALIALSSTKINNKILDACMIVSILILSRRYLKVAVLLMLLIFLIKFNTETPKENFQDSIENLKDDDDDDDDDEDDEPESKKSDGDGDTEKPPVSKEEKIQNLAKNSKPDVFYQKECFKKCMLFNKTEEECGKICNQICPNPINYSKDMAELAKLKIIVQNINFK